MRRHVCPLSTSIYKIHTFILSASVAVAVSVQALTSEKVDFAANGLVIVAIFY